MKFKNFFGNAIILIALIIFCMGLMVAEPVDQESVKKKWDYVLCLILCIIWGIVAALVALVIIINGLKYITTEGSKERDEAKNRLIHACIALSIILIAMPLVNYIVENTDIVEFECDCVGGIPTHIVVKIEEPIDGWEYEEGSLIKFRGSVFGGKSPYKYKWTSSVDGNIGSEKSFSKVLSRDTHIIKLEAIDDRGISGSDEIQIKVIIPKPIP